MVGFLVGALTGNDSHATQVGPCRWARHGGLGPKVNHSCDPNRGVRLNDGQELTFDYAMRNFTPVTEPRHRCGAAQAHGREVVDREALGPGGVGGVQDLAAGSGGSARRGRGGRSPGSSGRSLSGGGVGAAIRLGAP
jgi:hypothetical protein